MIWLIMLILAIAATGIFIYRSSKRKTSVRRNTNTQRTTQQQIRPVPVPPSQKNETGPMVYYANDRHGSSDREYRFNYKKVNGFWRAYILRPPSFGNRWTDGYTTHRLWDGTNPYVCWDRPVDSLKDMQSISKIWADCIQEYIATGKTFG